MTTAFASFLATHLRSRVPSFRFLASARLRTKTSGKSFLQRRVCCSGACDRCSPEPKVQYLAPRPLTTNSVSWQLPADRKHRREAPNDQFGPSAGGGLSIGPKAAGRLAPGTVELVRVRCYGSPWGTIVCRGAARGPHELASKFKPR